jgi:hypothetical protein
MNMHNNPMTHAPNGTKLRDIFEQAADRSPIDKATVFIKRTSNNRRFQIEFFGECKDLVTKRARREYDGIDVMASPSLGALTTDGARWLQTVVWWSAD